MPMPIRSLLVNLIYLAHFRSHVSLLDEFAMTANALCCGFLPQRRIPFTEQPPPAQAQQPHEDGSGEHYRDDVGGDVAVVAEPDGMNCGGQLIVLGSVTVRSAPPPTRSSLH